MRRFYFAICVFFFYSTVCLAESSKSLEDLVLCQQNDEVIELAQQIQKGDDFEKSGTYFYKPRKPVKAFGYDVVYIGLAGVDMIPGPNISVKGKYSDVEKSVKKIHKGSFECGPEGCDSQIDKYNHLMIYPHPADNNLTIIQCGYLGP